VNQNDDEIFIKLIRVNLVGQFTDEQHLLLEAKEDN
jgi:hypothetical protein